MLAGEERRCSHREDRWLEKAGTGRRGGQFLAGRARRELSLSSLAAGSENKRSVVKGRSDGARERQHRQLPSNVDPQTRIRTVKKRHSSRRILTRVTQGLKFRAAGSFSVKSPTAPGSHSRHAFVRHGCPQRRDCQK